MISGENLPFCAADSNKYIGRIHHFALSFRSPILSRKNVRIFMLSTIGEEYYAVKFACTMQTYNAIEETVERMWEKRGTG